jgi:hypothetical protein
MYFENKGENFLIYNMHLDSFNSLENELAKNIPAFCKELLITWIICGGRVVKVHFFFYMFLFLT